MAATIENLVLKDTLIAFHKICDKLYFTSPIYESCILNLWHCETNSLQVMLPMASKLQVDQICPRNRRNTEENMICCAFAQKSLSKFFLYMPSKFQKKYLSTVMFKKSHRWLGVPWLLFFSKYSIKSDTITSLFDKDSNVLGPPRTL